MNYSITGVDAPTQSFECPYFQTWTSNFKAVFVKLMILCSFQLGAVDNSISCPNFDCLNLKIAIGGHLKQGSFRATYPRCNFGKSSKLGSGG